jgi:uncharacterized membrane protein
VNEAKRSSHQHGTPARESVHHQPDPYWKRAHHDWRFWVGLSFMLAAITIYLMSNNLSFFSFFPPGLSRHAPPGAADKQRTP